LSGSELNFLIAKESGCYNIPDSLTALDSAEIRFTDVVDGNCEDIKNAVLRFLET